MSESNLTTTEEQRDNPAAQPVTSGPSNGEVKEIDVVDDDHPLVAETGSEALKTQTESGAGEFLSDFIYEHDSAWVREWLQNHETACVRAAKLLIRLSDEYPEGWLEVTKTTDEGREFTVPRPIDDVLEAAKSLGYDPTIVFDVYRDERKIITEDNGIGMTPYEFDKAFNTIFNSGSGVDGETGGMFGVGSESSALVHGNNGGCEVETCSRRPTEDGDGYDGFRAYSYLGGANALPGEVDDGFKGTRFIIPVQESFALDSVQEWIEDYSEKLRVPLLYREHDSGTTPVEEEYEATKFVDDYDDPAFTIERPGEFSVVAGPDVVDTGFHADDEDTFLVSMPIDRNTSVPMKTLWEVAIQIHDEQGRIVDGPNRGRYSDGSKVYETSEKRNAVGKLQEADVMLPEPTGDRDRLQKDSESKQFFRYVKDLVKSEELSRLAEICEDMKVADNPGDVLVGEYADYQLFRKMVKKHGGYNIDERITTFKNFFNGEDNLPDFDDATLRQMHNLIAKEVSYCREGPRSTNKRSRSKYTLGKYLAKYGDKTTYMAASTGGKFTDRFRVLRNRDPDAEVIVVNSSGEYNVWDCYFDGILKNVPIEQSDDHDFDVPDKIHDRNKKKNRGKPDAVLEKDLKIRNSGGSSSIDKRMDIATAKKRIEGKNTAPFGNGRDKLVLFPRTADENISDHYDLANYAAIASVTKSEFDELSDYDCVMTYQEYVNWSQTAPILTEDGLMEPAELVNDDRTVILAYRNKSASDVVRLMQDEHSKLRQLYAADVRDQLNWLEELDDYDDGYSSSDEPSDVSDDEKYDTLFGIIDETIVKRASHAFDNLNYTDRDVVMLRLSHTPLSKPSSMEYTRLDRSAKHWRLVADTPKWDDDSDVYDIFPSDRGSVHAQVLLGLHDRGIDPTEESTDDLRDMV